MFNGDLVGKQKDIIKELFKSQTVLYYTLVGQQRSSDGVMEDNVAKAIPKGIYDFKFLFHPIRISIVKVLYENLELTSIDMKDVLEISWNDYTTHMNALRSKGFILVEDKFIDGVKRQVLKLEPTGVQEYRHLTQLLQLFLENSTDYKAYIEVAQRNIENLDKDLYPSSK